MTDERRFEGHTSRMEERRAAHGDITALTVVYAVLFAAIVAGRFGWWGLIVFCAVVVPLLSRWVYRRGLSYRGMV